MEQLLTSLLRTSNNESIADILASIRDELVKMNNSSKIQNTPNIFDLLGKSMANNDDDDDDIDEEDEEEDDEEDSKKA
jgi:phosphopantothenoylcysteine synthetase/decarboxylase